MASVVTAGSPAQVAETDSAFNDDQLLSDLVDLWKPENKRGLHVRLETGTRLNDRLGAPTKRQARGQGVLDKVAEALDLTVSDLSRMRWFAHFHASNGEEFCWSEVPEGRRTWTKFKKLLPSLRGRNRPSKKQGSASGKKNAAVMSGILKMMASAASKLRSENRKIDGAKREKLLAKLTDFVSAISASTGLHLSLKEDENSVAV